MPDPNELKTAVEGIPTEELWALIQPVMPSIDRRIKVDGVRHQRIVKELNDKGLKISLSTFRVYLQRWRASQGKPPEDGKQATAKPVRNESKGGKTRTDFANLRSQDVDLEGFAEEAKEGK